MEAKHNSPTSAIDREHTASWDVQIFSAIGGKWIPYAPRSGGPELQGLSPSKVVRTAR